MYYDHYGEGIVNSFTQYGAFGLTSQVSSPQNIYTVGTAPRFTGLNAIPNVVTPPPSQLSYPVTPSSDVNGSGFAIAYGIDDHLKSPYSFAMDLSFQRELSRGFTFEAVYVGRLGRHLLQQIDLAAPLNLVDKGSGMDYYTAATLLDKQVDLGATTVSPIAYWENMFPAAAQNGASATQNIYTYLFQSERGNEVAIPFLLDVICSVPGLTNPCGTQTQRFWPYQYSSLYAWTSDGTSNYNAGQFTLRHALSHGLQMDFGYTFSKSMDIGSDAERTTSANYSSTFSEIIDAWNPQKNYGPSDFDVRHLITTNWTYLLPVGRGRQFGGGSSRVVDAVIGGWQLSGLVRWTSGLPFSIQDGVGWTTNWDFRSNMVQTGPSRCTGTSTRTERRRPLPTRPHCRAKSPADTPGGNRMPARQAVATTFAAMASSASTARSPRPGTYGKRTSSASPGMSSTAPIQCGSIPTPTTRSTCFRPMPPWASIAAHSQRLVYSSSRCVTRSRLGNKSSGGAKNGYAENTADGKPSNHLAYTLDNHRRPVARRYVLLHGRHAPSRTRFCCMATSIPPIRNSAG